MKNVKTVLFGVAVMLSAAALSGTCIISGSLDRPLAGTTTSAVGTCAMAVETYDCSRGEPSATIPLDVVERRAGDGTLRGAFSSRAAGLSLIFR